jgi:hypothetical protein
MRWTEEQLQGYLLKAGVTMASKINKPTEKPVVKRKASQQNKTEARFARDMLDFWTLEKSYDGYRFRALALIWPEYRYTPDFMAWKGPKITLFEIKGGHIHSRDSRIRFLGARRDHPWFKFECWQWKDGVWREIWK